MVTEAVAESWFDDGIANRIRKDSDMFKTNMGGADRAIRAVVGIILLALYFTGTVAGVWGWVALIVGIVLLATAALRWCPPYALLGINTCGVRKA